MRNIKPRNIMSMVCTVWHNGVYDNMTGIDYTGNGEGAGSSLDQMVASRKTTSYTVPASWYRYCIFYSGIYITTKRNYGENYVFRKLRHFFTC